MIFNVAGFDFDIVSFSTGPEIAFEQPA